MDGVGGRKRSARPSAEDQALDQIAKEAEARLAARRLARAEAREIRLRELERQQREHEENADRQYDMLTEQGIIPVPRAGSALGRTPRLSSRRSSEDSGEGGIIGGGGSGDTPGTTSTAALLRQELRELDEKFCKAMVTNAQLDNEKAAHTYQIELLKDRLNETEVELARSKREHRDASRQLDQARRDITRLGEQLTHARTELEDQSRLIAERGLAIVVQPGTDGVPFRALVTVENASLLSDASLDVRLTQFAEEKRELQEQLRQLRLELEEERGRKRRRSSSGVSSSSLHNGPGGGGGAIIEPDDFQREASKQLADYRFKLQKAEQDVATLQASVARLESQVIRYKSAAEASEKAEDELKVEKRKLQRESREFQARVEELETANKHLQKRLDKLKNAKSALLKEL